MKKTYRAVFNIFWVVVIQRIDTGDRHILFSVRNVFNFIEFPLRSEIIENMDVPFKIEKVDFEFGMNYTQIAIHFFLKK